MIKIHFKIKTIYIYFFGLAACHVTIAWFEWTMNMWSINSWIPALEFVWRHSRPVHDFRRVCFINLVKCKTLLVTWSQHEGKRAEMSTCFNSRDYCINIFICPSKEMHNSAKLRHTNSQTRAFPSESGDGNMTTAARKPPHADLWPTSGGNARLA